VIGLDHKWKFDLIRLDIRMPHMGGFQVMHALAAVDAADGHIEKYAHIMRNRCNDGIMAGIYIAFVGV